MAPTKVLWLVKGLGAGGAEILLLHAARQIDRQRFDVRCAFAVATKSRLVGPLEDAGARVYHLGRAGERAPLWMVRLWRLVRGGGFDVVHAHSPLLAVVARLAVRTLPRSLRPAMVSTEHNRWPRYRWLTRQLDGLTIGWDDAVLAVSDGVRDTIPALRRARVQVLHHGIDLDAVRGAGGTRDEIRRELGIAPTAFVVGVVANLRPAKDLTTMLRAAVRVIAAAPEARFVVAGQGPLADELAEQLAATDLEERFQFLGYRDDVHRLLRAFDLLAFSSLHEGLPVAAMEACAIGLPIVATDVGGMAEVVTDGVNGFLLPPSRPDLLAEAILRVAGDPARRVSMGHASAAQADRFDVRVSTAAVERLYGALLPPAACAAPPRYGARELLKRTLAAGPSGPVEAGTTVLIYHRVGGGTPDERDVTFDAFRRQVDEMTRHRVVSLDVALDELAVGDDSPKVVLTFDDGFADVHDFAWPLLRHHGLPFTVYLATAYLGGQMHWEGSTAAAPGPALTWDQVANLAADPLVTIGNHTHTHARPEALTAEELDRCSAVLTERVGVTPRHFAFTWGIDVPSARPLLEARFRSAATGALGRNHPGGDPLALRRVPVRGSDPLRFFRAKLRGELHPERAYTSVVRLAKRAGSA